MQIALCHYACLRMRNRFLEHVIADISSYDDLLARQAFRTSLAFHPKADRRFGKVLAPYQFLDQVPCGISACHTRHMKGYLITTSDGLETAIGSVCGRKNFGMVFTRERQRVDQVVARRRRIETVTGLLEDMPRMLTIIEGLERNYRLLQDQRQRLMDALGTDTYAALKQRASRGTSVINRSIPMTAAEAEVFFETSNRHQNDGLGWPHKEVPITFLEGLAFIKARFKEMLVTNLIFPLRNLSKSKPSDLESMKPRELATIAKWVGEVPQGIALAQEVVATGKRFFTSENIDKLTLIGGKRDHLAPMIEDLKYEESRV